MAKPAILWQNAYNMGTITIPVGGTAPGYDVQNIKDFRPYTWWQADALGLQIIRVTLAAALTADTVAIIGHNLFSAGGTYAIQTNAGAGTHDMITAPTSDRAFLRSFPSRTATEFSLYLAGGNTVPYRLAVVFIGKRLELERFLLSPFDPQPETIEANDSTSKTGNLLGVSVDYISRPISASWKNLTPAWVASYFKPVWDAHLGKCVPFFWAWDIGNFADEVYYCRIPPKFSLKMPYDPVRRSLTLSMQSIKEM
ncbi:MAG: hypothetical protein QME66_04710 [Candidatus Eisenbacteria bacterium]|nr:hypothetical protein [Candidatus Eisenbacteria bacterium]